MQLRTYKPDDLRVLNVIYREGISLLPCYQERKKAKPKDFFCVANDPNCFGRCFNVLLCFEEDGEVIGFACCLVQGKDDQDKRFEIRHIFFSKETQNHDIHKQAVAITEKELCREPTTITIRLSGLTLAIRTRCTGRVMMFPSGIRYTYTFPNLKYCK